MTGFTVEGCDDLLIDGREVLGCRELMSPYVWRHDGALGMLLRAVPEDEQPTGRIWYGRSDDGLRFAMQPAPTIQPSLDHLDSGGCEDPTVITCDDGTLVVFYTGVDGGGAAEMLWASGADIHSLEKRGIAYHCSKTEKNTKEASVLRRQDGAWCAFYEYSRDGASRIGFAIGETPSGPWEECDDPIAARNGMWDGHHLSTGPLLDLGDRVLMFYNGATEDAHWAIGWAVFDATDGMRLVERCENPLIAPPPGGEDDRRMAFANSLIEEGEAIHLYYSHNDAVPRRAILRRA